MTASTAKCAHCGAALIGDAAFCQVCGKATGVTPAPAPDPSDTITRLQAALEGRYTVEREVGRGGMATVYLAQDVRHDRRVAIKVLLPELAASVGGDRFIREIRVAAKLQHPHILTLYDSGDAGGLLYYVMPFVEGESLRDKLNREKMLPVDEALGLIIEIAEALGYAHAQGIVHRDIKPENILLSNGHALVADFGIARAVIAAEGNKLTQTGTAVGTPIYMSPEQAMGEDVGPTADLYSLGCMAFELLTGEPPFTGANARAIMARHTMELPPGIRLVRDSVPEEVEEAVLWTLAKVPADRPKNAAQFIDALATPLGATTPRLSVMRSRVTTNPRLTGMRRAVRVPVWRRAPVLIAAALVVLLAGGLAAWKARSGARGPADATRARIAVMYFDDQSRSRDLGYLADGLTEGLINTLREVSGLSVVSAGGTAPYRGSSVTSDSIARALGVGTIVRGTVERDGANVLVTLRLLEPDGTTYSHATFSTPSGNPIAIRDTLTAKAAELIRRRVGVEVKLNEQRAATRSPDAWALVQQGEGMLRRMDSLAATGDTAGEARAWGASDSMLMRAESLDAQWPEPVIMRGSLAYRRSRHGGDKAAVARWIGAGLGHAERAIALDARNPDALELRGTLRYWKWLNELEPDSSRAAGLLKDAEADLESATRVRPSQAGAWATLSHLYYQTADKGGTDINFAARNAWNADAYLSNADVILSRLFLSSYDLKEFPSARKACDDGVRRFPANWRFTQCRLMMLTTEAATAAGVTDAWRLADSMRVLSPPRDTAFNRLAANLFAAAVLARAGQADSARRVAGRSLGNADVDATHDLAFRAAFVYTLLGDTTAAINQLKVYFNSNPSKRQPMAADAGWWFRPIESTPAFRQLVGAASR